MALSFHECNDLKAVRQKEGCVSSGNATFISNQIAMKQLFATIVLLSLLTPLCSSAQSGPEKAVAKRLEQFRMAMIDANGPALEELTSAKLSYGHSNAVIEDKQAFLNKMISGQSDFVTMDLTERTVSVGGKTAIVRCRLEGETLDGGKAGHAKLHVLMIWQKEGADWKLLAPQATKLL